MYEATSGYKFDCSSERTPELPGGWVNWFAPFFQIADSHVLHHSSLDGYLFLRFLRMLCTMCFVGMVILWPVLMPIHATGGGGNTQLDRLSFSNVVNPTRYYAHVVMGMIYFSMPGFTIALFGIAWELIGCSICYIRRYS
jgi:hypothetical protein